jgi:hypothetical protein
MSIEGLVWIKSVHSWDPTGYAVFILGGLAFLLDLALPRHAPEGLVSRGSCAGLAVFPFFVA